MIELRLSLPEGVQFVSLHHGLDGKYHVCLRQARANGLNAHGIGVSPNLPYATDLAYNQLQTKLLDPDPGRDDWRKRTPVKGKNDLTPQNLEGINLDNLDL